MITPIILEGDKLITPKDKENELFGPKPVKKFDVFRPEVSQAPASDNLSNTEAQFGAKEVKLYNADKNSEEDDSLTQRVPLDALPVPREIVATENKEGLNIFKFKGFRSYN
jgi:hypothetical protein